MKILMVGATGEFAGLVTPELRRQGIEIKALLRSDKKIAALHETGITEFAIGDLLSPDTLAEAIKGVDGVFHINPQMEPREAEMGINMVKAAQAGGVKKFVFSGVYHPPLGMVNHRSKAPVEEAIICSGMDFTILQPSSFFQDLDAAWPSIVQTGQFAAPYGKEQRMSYVDYRDVAEVAGKAFVDDALSFGTFELSSAPMYNRVKVAGLMSEVLGRHVEATDVSFDGFAERARMPEGPVKEGLRAMFAYYDRYGFAGGNDLVLRTILGRAPRTLKEYLLNAPI